MAGSSRCKNLMILGIGSALAIVFGFILAAMIDREKRGEGLFPHDVSLSARHLADRHRRRLALDVQSRARRRSTSSTRSA